MNELPIRKTPMIWGGEKGGNQPCAACGRELRGRTFAVHVIDGGDSVLHPDDAERYDGDNGDMGLHLVGPECRRKFGEYAVPVTA